MSEVRSYTNEFTVKVDGAPLADDVEVLLERVLVDDALTVPDFAELAFRDPERIVIAEGRFKLGGQLEVLVDQASLWKGAITALEAEVDDLGSRTVVRGYDASLRLVAGRRTASYLDMKASDIAAKIAGEHGLSNKVDATSTVHKHVAQVNERDWDFLWRLADAVGHVVRVVDTTLHFTKSETLSSAPQTGDLQAGNPRQLVLGQNVRDLKMTVTAAAAVKEVEVRGWDPAQQKEVVSKEQVRHQQVQGGATPAKLAAASKGKQVRIARPDLQTQGETGALAKAVANGLGDTSTELTAVAMGHPDLKAGAAVSIGLAGEPFDGKYILSSARHIYDADEGYRTEVVVSPGSDRSLYGLTHAGGGAQAAVGGVVPGIVTSVSDPDGLGRVKVKFPWLDDTYESWWARVVMVGAGNGRGLDLLPEVNDEVLVALEGGDPGRPFVLGGLYSGKNKASTSTGDAKLPKDSGGKIEQRSLTSRSGLALRMTDLAGKEGIYLGHATPAKGSLEFRYGDKKVALTQEGELVVTVKGSPGTVTIDAQGDVKITTKGKVAVEATQDLSLKGLNVSIEAQANLKMKAGATGELSSNAPMTIKGAIVQIN